jgi:AraC family transcriptional regulator
MLEASTSRPDRREINLRPPASRACARGAPQSRGTSRASGTGPKEWPATRSCETDILVYQAQTTEVPPANRQCEVLLVQVVPIERSTDRRRGESVPAGRPRPGDVLLLDLRQSPSVAPLTGAINIALHRALLGEIAACLRTDRANPLDALTEACGRRLSDATIHDLALRASATLDRSDRGATVFRHQLGRALAAHLLGTYADIADRIEPARGGLAPWQLKRAQDRMRAALAQSLSIPAVAAACGLSPSHFARAFRRSTGVSPHAWLVRQRIARAKDLMRTRDLSLGDIAFACGFADQSHFTRVFARAERMSPGRWRRSIEPELAAEA